MTPQDELERAVDELYAGPPTVFVAHRDELAKQARAAGDRALATSIKALRRPSVGAWYLNVAARSDLTSLRQLLQLGRKLRDAQAGGDFAALRDLAAQRGPLVGRVVRDLTAHLAALGTAVTTAGLDEVRTTLASALADPEVAQQLVEGRLDRPHVYSGFGQLPAAPASAPPAGQSRPRRAKPSADERAQGGRSARERQAAQRELQKAENDLTRATSRRAAAESELAAAEALVESLTTQLEQARGRLAAAGRRAGEAAVRERELTEQVEKARARARS